jgi:hypothetical protein
MTPTKHFIPDKTISGGTPFGNSYCSLYANCPLAFFYYYVYPMEKPNPGPVAKGITQRFTRPYLLLGQYFHTGMEGLYRSGCVDGVDTGEWDVEHAIQVMRVEYEKSLVEYEESERAEKDWGLAESMLRNYYDEYSLNGLTPDYPGMQVMFNGDGEPLIEKQFSIELGYRDYIYTCRPDLIVTENGRLKVMEHKTSAYGMWLNKRIEKFDWDSQATGETFVLHALFPGSKIEGVIGNVLVKGGKTKKVERTRVSRAVLDIESFILATINVLKRIDEAVEGFWGEYWRGCTIQHAAMKYFPDHGTRTGYCAEYGGCQFGVLCRFKDLQTQQIGGFRPRTQDETVESREKPI